MPEILHAGQTFYSNVFEDRNFENPSRFAQDMIFSRKMSEMPHNDHFKNEQKMDQKLIYSCFLSQKWLC